MEYCQNEDPKINTIKYYDENSMDWSLSHGGEDEISYWINEMATFNKYLPSGKILEIGSGAGKDAKDLLKLGYDYVGTDASEGLLNLAEDRNPTAKFYKRYIHEIDSSLGEFDGFWASAVLLHIPKKEIVESLNRISSVLRDQAVGFITVKRGDVEKMDEETGRFYSYFQINEFKEFLSKTNFKILEITEREETNDSWLIFYVQKSQE